MQIPLGEGRRVDFHGNAKDGVYVERVNEDGMTVESRRLTDQERLRLLDTLTRMDNGRAV